MSGLSNKYVNDISKEDVRVLTLKEELELAKKIKNGCEDSLNKIIHHNLRLVIKTSQRYEGCGVDTMDLINEGNIGLMQAAKKYKASKGTKFSTYAGFWIRQKMIRYINNHGRTIRIPCHAYAIFSELKKEYEEAKNKDKELPSISSLALKYGCTNKKIKTLLPFLESTMSIDSFIGEHGSDTFEQHIPSIDLDANSLLQNKEKIQLIQRALKTLTNREKYIIEHRFGLHGDNKETLESIGKKFKVTRERIRQIESSALLKLKELLKEYKEEV